MRVYIRLMLFLLLLGPAMLTGAHGFSFSEYQKQEQENGVPAAPDLSELKCPSSLRSSRIVTMIGESRRDDRMPTSGYVFQVGSPNNSSTIDNQSHLVDFLNESFHRLGLQTLTAAELNEQIARAEQEAFLNNDLDAALDAAKKLQADYLLKGVISTSAQTNRLVAVEEVFVSISLALYNQHAQQLATTVVKATSFSDADVGSTIRNLLQTQADQITNQLFSDICSGSNPKL